MKQSLNILTTKIKFHIV